MISKKEYMRAGNKNIKQSIKTKLIYCILFTTSTLMILPFVWALLVSFMRNSDIISYPPRVWPKVWVLLNYTTLTETAPFFRFFLNSFLISFLSVLFIAITCPMAGYVLAKFKFKGMNLIFAMILGTTFVSLETYIIPLYLIVKSFGWINTYQGMIFPLLISSSGIFLLRQYIKGIPDSLIESSRIDGSSEFGIFWKIIFPLSLPATSAIIIIHWIYTWSQVFLWFLIMANTQRLFPMEIGLSFFQRQFSTDYGGLMAAAIVTVIPTLLFFLIFRTKIIDSIANTGTKY
ncbi:MAG: carbohydrate ABC transporter permease [Actinomycetia bacterium]|nr:carbohydrate ABC transporter permease [Actinomycetes bacterium]